MKKNILITLIFVFSLFISNHSFAFNLHGWWKADTGNNSLRIIKIDGKTFFGMPYKILSSSNGIIKISILNDEPTNIEINNSDNITVSYPSDETLTYERITSDTSLSKEAVLKMTRN